MRRLAMIALSGAIGLLLGCETETPNGELSSDYLGYAQKLVGSYSGRFDSGASGSLRLSLKGNKAILSFSSGSDIVGRGCKSRIGRLLRVAGSSSGLERAVFAFDSDCASGDELTIDVDSSQRVFSASLVKSSHTSKTCPDALEVMTCQQEVDDKYDGDERSHKKTDDMGQECRPDPFGDSECSSRVSRAKRNCARCRENTTYSYVRGAFRR